MTIRNSINYQLLVLFQKHLSVTTDGLIHQTDIERVAWLVMPRNKNTAGACVDSKVSLDFWGGIIKFMQNQHGGYRFRIHPSRHFS